MTSIDTSCAEKTELSAASEARIAAAVTRLNTILPLKARQEQLRAPLRKLHRDILNAYVQIGRSLSRKEIFARMEHAADAIRILAENDLIVVDGAGELTGAYPFTMQQREHKLEVNGHLVHCMCALDALAVSPMFRTRTRISSVCRASGQPIALAQNGYIFSDSGDYRQGFFGIAWSAASAAGCCADSLCTEMLFLKGDAVARNWRDQDAPNREIFTLDEAVVFAARFFLPVLE